MLRDYYNTGDDNSQGVSAIYRSAQTFTPSASYQLQSVKLLLHHGATYTDPGDITVRIYGTADGVPTGSHLATVTQSSSGLTGDSAGEWVEFTFSSPVSVSSGVMYAIVVFCESLDTYALYWRRDVTAPEYAGGTQCVSSDSGGSWTVRSGFDFMFETYDVASPYIDMGGEIAGLGGLAAELHVGTPELVGGGIAGLGGLAAGLRVETPELVGGGLGGSTLLSGGLTIYDSPPLAGEIVGAVDLSGELELLANWVPEKYQPQHRLVAFGNDTVYYEVL